MLGNDENKRRWKRGISKYNNFRGTMEMKWIYSISTHDEIFGGFDEKFLMNFLSFVGCHDDDFTSSLKFQVLQNYHDDDMCARGKKL